MHPEQTSTTPETRGGERAAPERMSLSPDRGSHSSYRPTASFQSFNVLLVAELCLMFQKVCGMCTFVTKG